jgi:hypothetical protein
MLVLLVAATKIHFKEQVLVAGTKQSRRANKTGRPNWQSGLTALFLGLACFVFCLLLLFELSSGFFY